MRYALLAATALALLGACSSTVQNTSGAAYLARSGPLPVRTEAVTRTRTTSDGARVTETVEVLTTDALVRKSADVEPILTLPARIGLARIEHGQLTVIPEHEAGIWQSLLARFPGLGEAVPVDPFLAEYTSATVVPQAQRHLGRDTGGIVTKIRLGAARQHLDAVLIYEVGAQGRDIDYLGTIRVLGGTSWRGKYENEGIARAILLDVRNGYPYAMSTATADLDGARPGIWQSDGDARAHAEATRRIVQALAAEIDTVFRDIARNATARVASK